MDKYNAELNEIFDGEHTKYWHEDLKQYYIKQIQSVMCMHSVNAVTQMRQKLREKIKTDFCKYLSEGEF